MSVWQFYLSSLLCEIFFLYFTYLLLCCQFMALVYTQKKMKKNLYSSSDENTPETLWLLRSGKSRIKWTAWNLQVGRSFGVYHPSSEALRVQRHSFVQLVIKGKPFWVVHSGKGNPAVPMPPRVLLLFFFSFSSRRTRQTLDTWRDADVRLPECGSSMEPRARLPCPFL